MGGGLFGTPLYLNAKCIVFSGVLLAVYWMPHFRAIEHEIVFSFVLATFAYVLLAWYDVIYDCNDRLQPTLLGWMTSPLKPAYYGKALERLPVKYKKTIRMFDVAVLGALVLLVLAPYVKSA
jgi:hypothetical protein